jgi:enamine deaminase RidA (YjgF/YER057c/UK114 family)
VLRAAGCGFADVVQCTAYIVGVENWPAFNAAYARVFGSHKPARAVVPVAGLHYGFLVEVQLVAQRPAS